MPGEKKLGRSGGVAGMKGWKENAGIEGVIWIVLGSAGETSPGAYSGGMGIVCGRDWLLVGWPIGSGGTPPSELGCAYSAVVPFAGLKELDRREAIGLSAGGTIVGTLTLTVGRTGSGAHRSLRVSSTLSWALAAVFSTCGMGS